MSRVLHRLVARTLLVCVALLALPGAHAHHGFTGEYDASSPLYLAGEVVEARLGQPHSRIRIAVPAELAVPPESAALAHYDKSHGADLLARLRPWAKAETVEILLEPFMTRETTSLRRPAVGEKIEAIAFARMSKDASQGELRVILLALDEGQRVLTAPRRSYHRAERRE